VTVLVDTAGDVSAAATTAFELLVGATATAAATTTTTSAAGSGGGETVEYGFVDITWHSLATGYATPNPIPGSADSPGCDKTGTYSGKLTFKIEFLIYIAQLKSG
jgi:hypothetical protein